MKAWEGYFASLSLGFLPCKMGTVTPIKNSDEKNVETPGGDVCTAMCVYLMPLNGTLKND